MPRSIPSLAVMFMSSAGRARAVLTKHVLEGCVLALFLVIGAGAPAAHPADPTGTPAADKAALQSTLQAGIAAAEAGRLSEAIIILTPHAKRGNATANYALGLIYMRGTGDAATAAKLSHRHFRNAAQRGHVGAVFEVAFQFERGIGTEPDVKRAIRLYQLAARSTISTRSTIWRCFCRAVAASIPTCPRPISGRPPHITMRSALQIRC